MIISLHHIGPQMVFTTAQEVLQHLENNNKSNIECVCSVPSVLVTEWVCFCQFLLAILDLLVQCLLLLAIQSNRIGSQFPTHYFIGGDLKGQFVSWHRRIAEPWITTSWLTQSISMSPTTKCDKRQPCCIILQIDWNFGHDRSTQRRRTTALLDMSVIIRQLCQAPVILPI